MKIRDLTWGALIVALHIVTLLIPSVIPGSEFLLLLIAPIFSAFYTIKVQKKSVLILAISTLVICGLINLYDTLLFILPVLISGIVYGYLAKKGKDNLRTIYVLAICQVFLFFISALIIEFIYKIDIVDALMGVFRLRSEQNKIYTVPLLVAYCFASASLIHYVLKHELEKLSITFTKYEEPSLAMIVVSLCLVVAGIILPRGLFVTNTIIVFALVSSFPIIYYYFIKNKQKGIKTIIALCASFLVATLPLLKFAPIEKTLFAYSSVLLGIYILGIVDYFKYLHFKKLYK